MSLFKKAVKNLCPPGYIRSVMEHAVSIGRLGQLLDRLDYLDTYDTYFGVPVECRLWKDFAPYSFYWEKHSTDGHEGSRGTLCMNGGLIFHPSCNEWSVHT
jgi:hypothetical protein